MKKILVLLSIFALASGAWAEATYEWAVTITDIPVGYGLPSDLVCYLVDMSVKESTTTMYVGAVMARANLIEQMADGATYSYQTYKPTGEAGIGVSDMFAKFHEYEGTLYTTFKIASTSFGIEWNNMGMTTEAVSEYAKDNLYAVISSQSTGKKLDLKVTPNGAIFTLGSNGSFKSVEPVPEPTSGLLLLLGVAGLALKRKKAA